MYKYTYLLCVCTYIYIYIHIYIYELVHATSTSHFPHYAQSPYTRDNNVSNNSNANNNKKVITITTIMILIIIVIGIVILVIIVTSKIIPAKICRLNISGYFPMFLGIPPLRIKITLESNTPTSRFVVRRLALSESTHSSKVTSKVIQYTSFPSLTIRSSQVPVAVASIVHLTDVTS